VSVATPAVEAVGGQADGLDRLHALSGEGATIVLTGMGSSYDACLAAASVLARRGVIATPINAAELLHFRLGALTSSTVVIAVSQSGGSAELVRLAERLGRPRERHGGSGERPALVSVTNGIGNPLARRADIAFDIAAGREEGPSTKTFATTLVALRILIDAIAARGSFAAAKTYAAAARDTERAAAAAARLLADSQGLAERMRAWCRDRSSLVILGRGTARAAAEMGALIIKEAAHRQAESLDTAEFRHGPLELSGPDLAVAIISTEAKTRAFDARLAAELTGDGASVMMVTSAAGAATAGFGIGIEGLQPMLAPAVAVIPLQLLAWRLAIEGGRDPGRFERGSKVTTRE
jgi:glucosamine--fructose-6-phosphate aminotransferase (isomerizing)